MLNIETKELKISDKLKRKDQPLKLISSINCNLLFIIYFF